MEMESRLELKTRQTAAARLAADEIPDLSKRPRIHEEVIRYTLLACGLISILTTLGIVFVLGSESLRFFSRMGFLNTNQELVTAINEHDTTLQLTGTGSQVKVGDVLQLNEEPMQITQLIDNKTVVVQRGFDGAKPEAHPADTAIYIGERVNLIEFLTGTKWQPQAAEFGVLPLVTATLMTSLIAMLVAGPLGLGVAVYLSEYASTRVRATLKPILEVLAGVPTVVFGYFALTFITPLLRTLLNHGSTEVVGTYNMASAGLVMGIMIIPTISSISEDALSAVPRSLREASYGLGATRIETILKVLLPAALSGITAAFILGISRAVGETMIVAIASGAGPNFTVNPFAAAETMTGHIARISTGDVSFNSIDYNSLFAIGLTLFVITLVLNLISGAITRRFREVYQ
jgi:phosphate transport system permease protein